VYYDLQVREFRTSALHSQSHPVLPQSITAEHEMHNDEHKPVARVPEAIQSNKTIRLPCSNHVLGSHAKCIAAPPTARTAAAAAGVAHTAGTTAGARAACSKETATVMSASAPA
jgi:hypothetical protein